MDVYFDKIYGTGDAPVAEVQNSRWPPRWPPKPIWCIISGSINDTDVILVSRIRFSGSRNPNKITLTFSDHHVTTKIKEIRLNGKSLISQELQKINVPFLCLGYGFWGQGIQKYDL